MTLLAAALDLAAHGCSVIPVVSDGTKRPAVDWKTWQSQRPGETELRTWFTDEPIELGRGHGHQGIGVITGAVSGNLELLEVEGRAIDLVPALAQLLTDSGMGELWQRICTGWLVQSPSGGLHFLYRVEGGAVTGNTKLARRPSTPEELDTYQAVERDKANATMEGDKLAQRLARIDALTPERIPQVLLETRGEGGYLVTAPSAGRTHATGKAWALVAGGPATCPTITVEERDVLHIAASTFDAMPVRDDFPAQPPLTAGASGGDGQRPGDDYNARATWDDILTPHGWQRVKKLGSGWGWVRPGKNPHDGISATTGTSTDGVDRLYVFSTSTEFESEKPYSKFAAHALLEHGGDMGAAASALRKSGYGAPLEQARPTLQLVQGGEAPPTGPVNMPGPTAPGPSTYTLTDDGNALRLVDGHGATLRYCPEAGSWLRWNGHRWSWDTAGHVHELAREVARRLPQVDKADEAHRKRTLSNLGLKGMVSVARTDARILVSPDQLDARPYELNTPAGVADLRTGTIRTPDPAALHTRSTPIAPDFEAPTPRWDKFLADTFAGDPALTTYVQRLLGLSLIGEHLEQILPFGWGSGANGKSTLLNVTQGVVGIGQDGYSIPAPAELLLASHNRSHPTELARLSGARLVVASELEDGERFAESRIKMLTGGENIAARFMGKDFFSFKPTHTIWLLANDQPAVRAGGPAFWRRLRLLPFVHVVPPAERITGLDHQLIDAEGPAILAWLIRGAMDYLRDGLAEPASVRAATGAYERDQDTVARYVEECCETGPQGAQHMTVRVAQLRTSYENWCRAEGETPVSAKALTTALTARFGVASVRSSSARFYAGIRVTDVSPESPQDEPDRADGWWQR